MYMIILIVGLSCSFLILLFPLKFACKVTKNLFVTYIFTHCFNNYSTKLSV